MGSAISGLHVAELVLDAETLGIAGGMAHCPVLDGYATLTSLPPNPRLLFCHRLHRGRPGPASRPHTRRGYPRRVRVHQLAQQLPWLRLKDARCRFFVVMAADNDLNDPELAPALATA
ncbi:hypothetical protein FB451DRAFT_1257327, partial [Mycena latifolia]